MKKSQEFELRKRCGDLNGLCGIKDYVFNDGPARGVRAFDLKNGRGLELTVLADRGLDIPYLSYKGINIGLLNKVGVRSPHLYREDGASGFLKQFYAGMLTTCGLTYAGAAGEDGGVPLGLHGPFDNLPAAGARGMLVTFGSGSAQQQFFTDSNGQFYMRFKWGGTWKGWFQIAKQAVATTTT